MAAALADRVHPLEGSDISVFEVDYVRAGQWVRGCGNGLTEAYCLQEPRSPS